MSSELQDIEISEPLLQSIMGDYIDELRKKKPLRAELIESKWFGDISFYNQARQALSEAVILSTLACTATHTEDFENEMSNFHHIEDEIISCVRHDIFIAGVRCAVETIGFEQAQKMKVNERVALFERATIAH